MQLHTLTETARTILAQHGETRFFWRYDDPYVPSARFEVLFTAATDPTHGLAQDAELFVCQYGGVKDPWNHAFALSLHDGIYQCSARLDAADYYALIDILHIGRRRQGAAPWSPVAFLTRIDAGSAQARNNWDHHRVQTTEDLPMAYRANVEEADKIYYLHARRISPNGPTEENQEKTRRLIGPMWARKCKELGKSTCWTDKPPTDKDGNPLPPRIPKDSDCEQDFR
ncbi:DUF6037 family protein [Bifidobacterium pseudolongum]|uniref:DUF6037 family protein n=1 Tax=Bifidobacterium pseudolongum TaxID=1694 RepID=UPI00101FA354|nr:DUF6037 family protein [Bifidobacterium pseudolongum]RYQ06035.1 hypothetical protein PG2105B_1444 [Bifidobacterium pseudolongum subsp. globosum]